MFCKAYFTVEHNVLQGLFIVEHDVLQGLFYSGARCFARLIL